MFVLKGSKSTILLLILCLVLSLSGCSTVPRQPKADSRIELEFWTLQMMNFSGLMNSMIADYEKMHPNIHIKWVDVPFSEGEKKALTSMLAKKTPDIINLNPDFSAILANRGALLNMNQWVSPQERESFLPVAWQAASLGRETFGLPWYLSSSVTIYNRKLFQEVGLNGPPQDNAALAAMAKTFQEKSANYLLMPAISDGGRFFRVLAQNGIPIWNQHQTLVFADHGAGKTLDYWVKLYQAHLVPAESLTEDQQAAVDRYQSGTLGLLLTGPNFLNLVRENAPEVFRTTDVAPQFPAQSPSVDFAEMLLVIPKQAPHPREALDFALFVTNAENTLKLSALAPVLPPHSATLQAPVFQQFNSTDLMAKGRSISAAQLLKAKTAFQIHPLQNRLNQIMDFYVQSALLGKCSAQEAMVKAQQEMNQLIQ
jgi:putative chitobiose transport system substrate-binding protein